MRKNCTENIPNIIITTIFPSTITRYVNNNNNNNDPSSPIPISVVFFMYNN